MDFHTRTAAGADMVPVLNIEMLSDSDDIGIAPGQIVKDHTDGLRLCAALKHLRVSGRYPRH